MKQFKKYFAASLRTRYPSNAESLLIELDKEFQLLLPDVKFAATSSNPIDRRLIFCAYFLALIKVLDNHGESFEQIRVVSLEIVKEYVRPKNGFQALSQESFRPGLSNSV